MKKLILIAMLTAYGCAFTADDEIRSEDPSDMNIIFPGSLLYTMDNSENEVLDFLADIASEWMNQKVVAAEDVVSCMAKELAPLLKCYCTDAEVFETYMIKQPVVLVYTNLQEKFRGDKETISQENFLSMLRSHIVSVAENNTVKTMDLEKITYCYQNKLSTMIKAKQDS